MRREVIMREEEGKEIYTNEDNLTKFYFDFIYILKEPIKNVKLLIAAPLRQIMSEINSSWSAENIAKSHTEAEEKIKVKSALFNNLVVLFFYYNN
jgi:hypothetical protein